MKLHLQITRHNNKAYREENEELKAKIIELEELQKSKTGIKSCQTDIRKNEDLALKIKELEDDLQKSKEQVKNKTIEIDYITARIQDLRYSLRYAEIQKLKTNLKDKEDKNSKCEDDLQQKENELTEKRLQCEEKNLKCIEKDLSNQKLIQEHKSNHSRMSNELESLKKDFVIGKKELEECQEKFEDQIQKTQNLQTEKSELMKYCNR